MAAREAIVLPVHLEHVNLVTSSSTSLHSAHATLL